MTWDCLLKCPSSSTSDVDLDDKSDGGKVTTNEDEDIEVPHTVYVPGSNSEEEDNVGKCAQTLSIPFILLDIL